MERRPPRQAWTDAFDRSQRPPVPFRFALKLATAFLEPGHRLVPLVRERLLLVHLYPGRIPDISLSKTTGTIGKEVEGRPVLRKPRRTVIRRAIHRNSEICGYRPCVRHCLPRRGPNINASLSAWAV